MIKASTKGKEFTLAPEGTFVARIVSLIHIGTNEEEYQGDKFDANKVRIGFELPTETHEFKEGEGEKPFVVSQEYTLSIGNKAKLRPLVKGALNFTDEKMSEIEKGQEEYDIADVLGKAVQVTLIHKTAKSSGNKYIKIEQVTGLVKGMEAPEQINTSYLMDYDNFTDEKLEKLPEFIQDKIKTSKEYKKLKGIEDPRGPTEIDEAPEL